MAEIINLPLKGQCDLCEEEKVTIYPIKDKKGKGHKVCTHCLEKLIEWGLIEKPGFEIKYEV